MAATQSKAVIQEEKSGTKSPVWLEYFKAFGPWSLTIAALVWSIYSFDVQQQNLANQIEMQQRSAELARKQEAIKLGNDLLPWIKCEGDERREIALEKLRISAPEELKIVVAILEKCPKQSGGVGKVLETMRQQGSQNELEKAFVQLVNNGRQYQRNGLEGPAARTFAEAANSLPQSYVDDHIVNLDQLSLAQEAWSDARFSTASDFFGQAFRKVPGDLDFASSAFRSRPVQ